MIGSISRKFGEPIEFEGARFCGFPEPRALARASIRDLRLCRLGYRAERVRETARLINRGDFDLESLKGLSYVDAKKMLMSLPGVGSKVADCVLLFSLDKLEAFPIDVWMKRIMLESYSAYFESGFVDRVKGRRSLSHREYEIIYAVGSRIFGEFLGYAQEYLYHFRRCQAL
jgi:N-glycosylase/DNA lyase